MGLGGVIIYKKKRNDVLMLVVMQAQRCKASMKNRLKYDLNRPVFHGSKSQGSWRCTLLKTDSF